MGWVKALKGDYQISKNQEPNFFNFLRFFFSLMPDGEWEGSLILNGVGCLVKVRLGRVRLGRVR